MELHQEENDKEMKDYQLTKIYTEGLLSRAKAGMSGLKASAGNILNKGQQAVSGVKAAAGQTIGNQAMAQSGASKVQDLKQQATQATTSQDARATSINKTFVSKINKEISSFNSQLSKALDVTDPSQLVSTLEQTVPEMAELYNSIQSIVTQVQQPQATQPPQSPEQPEKTPEQKQDDQPVQPTSQTSGFNYTGSNQKLLDIIKNMETRGVSRDQVMQYLNNKKKQ